MCGIAGELRFDGASPLAYVTRVHDVIHRRGPHRQRSFITEPAGLSHTRMSVIDLTDHSDQPMTDVTSGLTLVFNGTIYNYPELRAELKRLGHHFQSTGDTEVILKAYIQWGKDCVKRFNGVFAFGIWDDKRNELFIARDHLGIKPVYYCSNARRFRFASNPQALILGGDVDTSLNTTALHHHLTLHGVVPPPDTILNGVKKLPPATTLTVDRDGKVTSDTYWRLSARRPDTPLSEQQWREKIEPLLRESVIRRYEISDIPTGILLSGGIDSSLILAILKQANKDDVRTWSIGFEDAHTERGDEFHYSDMMVDRYKTQHKRIVLPNNELAELLPETIEQMPEPMVGQDSVAFYAISKHVQEDIRIVQCGQGADELFGGYFWYPLMANEEHGSRLERFRKHYFDRSHADYLSAIAPDYQVGDVTAEKMEQLLDNADADSFIDAVWLTDMQTLIVDDPVKRVDSMTMAWGLEARVPFLDVALVETVMQMPPELKIPTRNSKTMGKYMLKQIATGIVPDEIIHREKAYFPVPMLKHMDNDIISMARDVLSSQACRTRGLFERDYIEQLFKEPQFTPIQGNKLWHHTLLELWLQTNVDNTAAPDIAQGGAQDIPRAA